MVPRHHSASDLCVWILIRRLRIPNHLHGSQIKANTRRQWADSVGRAMSCSNRTYSKPRCTSSSTTSILQAPGYAETEREQPFVTPAIAAQNRSGFPGSTYVSRCSTYNDKDCGERHHHLYHITSSKGFDFPLPIVRYTIRVTGK